jgi:hypothetical protein
MAVAVVFAVAVADAMALARVRVRAVARVMVRALVRAVARARAVAWLVMVVVQRWRRQQFQGVGGGAYVHHQPRGLSG